LTNATHPDPAQALAARFDWYSATIDDSPADVERSLALALDAGAIASTPMHGYEHARDFRDGDGHLVAKLLYGGHEKPHALATGSDAQRFAEVVRALWPRTHAPGGSGGHYVTRFDSAIDYRDGAAWDGLYAACIALAERKNLRLGTAGDWITPDSEHGRTLYVGSATSDVQVRLYEKGKQLRESLADPLEAAATPRDWVRLEVRVRPQRDARHRAATSSPVDGWGFAVWTRALLADVAGLDVEPTSMQEHRETDDERAFVHMVRQYGKMLARRASLVGGWDALGLDIERQADELGQFTGPQD
jgi:hypothetical protein